MKLAAFKRVDRRRRIGAYRYDPEYEPQRRPWLSDDHGDILASKTQRCHTDKVEHPVNGERASPVGCRSLWGRRLKVGSRGRPEGDLESEGNDGVGQGDEEIGDHGGTPAPDNELPEMQRRMALGLDIFLGYVRSVFDTRTSSRVTAPLCCDPECTEGVVGIRLGSSLTMCIGRKKENEKKAMMIK